MGHHGRKYRTKAALGGLQAGLFALAVAGCGEPSSESGLRASTQALSQDKAITNTFPKALVKLDPEPEVSLKEVAYFESRRACRLSELAELRVDLATQALAIAGASKEIMAELEQLAHAARKQTCAGADATKTQAAAAGLVAGLDAQLSDKLEVKSPGMSIVDALIGDSIQDFLENCLDPKQLDAIERLAEADLGALSDEDYLLLRDSMGRSDCNQGLSLGGGGASRLDFLGCMQSAIDERAGRSMVLCEDGTAGDELEDDLAEPEDPIDYLDLDDDDDFTRDEDADADTVATRIPHGEDPLLRSPYSRIPSTTSEYGYSPSSPLRRERERMPPIELLPSPYGRRTLEDAFDQLFGGGSVRHRRPSRFCPAFAGEGGTAQRMYRFGPREPSSPTYYSPFISMADVVVECRCRTGRAPVPGSACGSELTDPFRISCVVPYEPGVYTDDVSPECQDAFADDAPDLGAPECGAMTCDDGYELTPGCRCVPAGSDGNTGIVTDPCAHVDCGPDAVCTPSGCQARSSSNSCGGFGMPCLEDLELSTETFNNAAPAQPLPLEAPAPQPSGPFPRP